MVYSSEYYKNNKDKISKQRSEYYKNNKDKINERINEYHKNSKEYQMWKYKYYTQKWYPKNRIKIKALMKRQYEKHKVRFISRARTTDMIYGRNTYRKIIGPVYECKCKAKQNLQIHHEVYPTKKAEIIKAIEDGCIYYLCKSCHSKLRLLQKE